jgi:ABC-2 type transport system ATP-binding protein
MLQESGVALTLTVREALNLFRTYYPAPLPTAQLLALAELDAKAGTRVGTLSGGQRQRLYFALAICGNPELLFLDEPTAALDVEGRRTFWAQMRGFVQQGRTIVLTTHYLEEADTLADRVIVIDQGHLIADAPPAALKARVAGKRVSFDLAAPLDQGLFTDLPIKALELTQQHATLLTAEPELVLQRLFATGARLQNLEVVGAGLEEAILSLTGKD